MSDGSARRAVRYRVFVEAALAAGGGVALDEEPSHYLRNVLRLEPGDAVALFNGRDGEYRGVIERVTKRAVFLTLAEKLRPQAPEPDVWLLFAPIKRLRIDLVAEKATELGASRLLPVLTRHTEMARVNTARLRAHAVEAAEQCGRLSVPVIDEPASLDQVIAAWDPSRHLYLCAETGAAQPIASVVGQAMASAAPRGPFAVLVGPEGGFAEAELDGLRNLDFVSALSLGPRILRAETAALAALAILQAWLGDWSRE